MTGAQMTVSVLGLGLMGAALAEALLNAGHNVTVWNRTAEKTGSLAAKGAKPVATVAEALTASDVSVICVTDHVATLEMLHGVAAPGGVRTLIQLSTTTPDQSRALAAQVERLGMRYLDGSILGLPSTVLKGLATVIYSGPAEIFDAHQALLAAMGEPLHLSSKIGASPIFDRVWYAYVYGTLMSFLVGAAMADRLGFSLEVYNDIVKARTPIMLDQLLVRGEKARTRSYRTVDASIDVWAAAFDGTVALCRETGVDDRLPAAVMASLRSAIDAGRGRDDVAAVFETLAAR